MHQFRPWTRMKGSMLSLISGNRTQQLSINVYIIYIPFCLKSFLLFETGQILQVSMVGSVGKKQEVNKHLGWFSSFQWNFSGPPPWLVIGQVSLLKRLERFGFERWRIHSQKTRCDVGDNLKSCYFCEQIWRWGSQNIVVLKSLFL